MTKNKMDKFINECEQIVIVATRRRSNDARI